MSASRKPERVFILDPALFQALGHHPGYHRALAKEFSARGIETIHLANRDCVDKAVDGLKVGKLFRRSPYVPFSTDPLVEAWESFFALADSFEEDMAALRPGFMASDDIVVLPVTAPGTLFGYIRWWGTLDRASRPRTAIFFQMQAGIASLDPLVFNTEHPVYRETARQYRFAGNQLDTLDGEKPLFFTATNDLVQHYAYLLKQPVALHGLQTTIEPSQIDPIAEAFEASDTPPTIGYFGDLRFDKGFELLSDVLEIMLERHSSLRFVIQASGIMTGLETMNNRMFAMVERIQKLAESTGRIDLLRGFASMADFCAAIARADMVLQPYRLSAYRFLPSGIFSDAASIGRPSVVPAGTWMAQQVDWLGGLGAVHDDYEPATIAQSALGLVERTKELRARGPELRSLWRNAHGTNHLVDCILGETA